MNLVCENDGGEDRRLCALECNQLKLGGCRESRLSVQGKEISLVKKHKRRQTIARSQKRMTSARAAYATHLPFLMANTSEGGLPESTSKQIPFSSVKSVGVLAWCSPIKALTQSSRIPCLKAKVCVKDL